MGVLCLLANVPVLFISFLVSDKLYSKLERLLGLRVVGSKVITSVMFETGLSLVEEDRAFNVVREVICGTSVDTSGVFRLKVEEDRGS
jgi:hypothetical protein